MARKTRHSVDLTVEVGLGHSLRVVTGPKYTRVKALQHNLGNTKVLLRCEDLSNLNAPTLPPQFLGMATYKRHRQGSY